jgi:formate hydrogenlyase transcriptional activator
MIESITRACSDQRGSTAGADVDQQAEHLASEPSECPIVGRSLAIQRMLHLVRVVAPTDSTVLIEGETGSGKELVARTVSDLSGRRRKASIKLNCAAMPAGLLESELFGHEKGAFTGATAQRRGRFELADGGTLFLDEIGDIPLELQPKLLRVLQEQEFERLGGTRTIRTDVRVVAATNRDLARMVEEGRFRADLYYRLNVFPVRVPPLRERREDIPLLANFFVVASGRRLHRWFAVPDATLEALTRYAWPGNVRELQHFVERGAILSTGSVLDLPLHELATTDAPIPRSGLTLEDMEREYIVAVLRETNWVVAGSDGAAARLGLKRTTLFSRMRKLGIQRRSNPARPLPLRQVPP